MSKTVTILFLWWAFNAAAVCAVLAPAAPSVERAQSAAPHLARRAPRHAR